MKWICLLLTFTFLASCQQKKEQSSSDKPKESTSTHIEKVQPSAGTQEEDAITEAPKSYDYYAGTIGLYGEDVLMEVHSNDNNITGRYWYLKHGRQIQLSGTKSGKGNEWQLQESVKNVVTGNMTLAVSENELTGQWYAPGKKSQLQEVRLQKVYHTPDGPMQPNFETYTFEHIISIYNGEEDEQEEAEDDIKLVRIGDYVLFQYFVIGHNAHVGHINGLAKMVSKNKAVFKGEDGCELSITFEGEKVSIVEEESCSYYRGMRAHFGGTLTKSK
jgi:hypothetical protein